MKTFGVGATVVLMAVLYGSVAQAALVVDWGGQYVSGNTNLAREGYNFSKVFDADLVANDTRRQIPISETLAMSPGSGYSGTSDRFYGGAEYWKVNVGFFSTDRFAAFIMNNAAATGDDTIRMYGTENSTLQRIYGLVLWEKADFLNGGDTMTLDLGSGAALRILLDNDTLSSAARFVVKASGSYYISDFVTTLEESLVDLSGAALASTLWAPYSPGAADAYNPGDTTIRPALGLVSPAASLTYSIPTSSLTDITAVGYYHEQTREESAAGPGLAVAKFQAELMPVVIPEPGTMVLVALGCLAGAMRRR